MNFTDAVQIGDVRATADGYMVADVRVARTGIQIYHGKELGKPNLDLVRVFRPEEEVFASDAMSSFAHKPVTLNHPQELVTPATWKRHSIGFTSGDVARDGGFLRVPLMVADGTAILSVQSGKRELSAGYTCDLDWTAGETPDGERFDAKQVRIRANHIAVVDAARAGPACRIGDGWPNADESPPATKDEGMPDLALRTVTYDGIAVQTTEQGAQVIDRLTQQVSDLNTAIGRHAAEVQAIRDQHTAALNSAVQTKDGEIAGLKAMHDSAIQAKDGEIAGLKATHDAALAAKDGEIAGLKAQMPTADQMDALIADRANVIDAARKVLGDKFDPKGKSNAEIRRAAVEKRLGAAAVADKSDDYIGAAFDTLTAVGAVAPPSRDPVRDALIHPNHTRHVDDGTADDAHDAYVASLRDAWRAPSTREAV